jgi:nitrogen fixation NifU-like protein
MYTPIAMDHFQNPRNAGELPDANAVGRAASGTYGVVFKLYLKIEGGKVEKAAFKTFGCGAAIAASSVLTEMVKGKTLDELKGITNEKVNEALGGLPPFKMHCASLAEEVLKAALEDHAHRK